VTEATNREKIELDYAYLAEFAQVSDGKITAVGAALRTFPLQ
jgi:hypothetical protein